MWAVGITSFRITRIKFFVLKNICKGVIVMVSVQSVMDVNICHSDFLVFVNMAAHPSNYYVSLFFKYSKSSEPALKSSWNVFVSRSHDLSCLLSKIAGKSNI